MDVASSGSVVEIIGTGEGLVGSVVSVKSGFVLKMLDRLYTGEVWLDTSLA